MEIDCRSDLFLGVFLGALHIISFSVDIRVSHVSASNESYTPRTCAWGKGFEKTGRFSHAGSVDGHVDKLGECYRSDDRHSQLVLSWIILFLSKIVLR